MLLQTAAATAGSHPLAGTVAEYLWLLPLLPLLGFVINGLLSLVPATRFGPKDPNTGHGPADAHGADHGGHAHAGHGPEHGGVAIAHSMAEQDLGGHGAHASHGAGHVHDAHADHSDHGDDHHAVKRHRFAGIVSVVGPLALAASFGLAAMIFLQMLGTHAEAPFIQHYFSWMPAGDLQVDAAFQLDRLSMIMVLVITGVGTLIHLFSIGYMQDDPGYPRYFAYLNLFVFFMLILVLGANYPMLFIGWEGVGLCSYLLIGYWFSEKANADAGKKAFIVNRIGDFGFLVAMFLIFANFGTLDFLGVEQAVMGLGPSVLITAICLFLFLGCTGKSAQIPLYVWLPDAMAGPTPVSALIHAATMVTAGVYLIARSSFLFSLSATASLTVAAIGALTALFAATIGLKQWDIKKVLAYSTVSQLGYMFIGVGVGAYTAGVFHLVTHAFFKALLFLGSGSVIFAMHRAYHALHNHDDDAQDMRNMGGLRAFMPVTWFLMWVATLAIAGVFPLSGFFSKDEILASVFARTHGSTLAEGSLLGIPGGALLYAIWAIGLVSALLTAIYMTRMMIYTFHGPNRTGEPARKHLAEAPWIMTGPLVILGLLSAFGGWLNLPVITGGFMGPTAALHHWLEPVTGRSELVITHGEAAHLSHSTEYVLIAIALLVAAAGIVFAFVRLKPARLVPKREAPAEEGFGRVLANKYYVDEAYDRAIIGPTVDGSRSVLWRGIDAGLIDGVLVNFLGWRLWQRGFARAGSWLQSGQLGTYAWVLVIGVVVVLGAFTL